MPEPDAAYRDNNKPIEKKEHRPAAAEGLEGICPKLSSTTPWFWVPVKLGS